MKTSRIGIHLLSVFLLVLWGAVLLYFYASGRIVAYLPADGIFRPMVLVAGIGMGVLGLFNLATIGAKEDDCCDHDHGHDKDDGHHHHEGCDHDHGTKDHAECSHEKEHKHDECCGHDHHEEKPKAAGCGHDHSHDHSHGHDHEPSHDHADHAHGILNESGAMGRLVAILILVVPVSYAAINSPDRYSSNAIVNKGLYNPNYGKGARAEEYSLKKEDRKQPMADPTVGAPVSPDVAASPVPVANPKEVEKQAAKGGAQTKSFGSFTLKDLEAQIAKSPEGNFMLEVPEIYYTAGDKEVQSVLDGQPVETIAQVLPEKVNNPDGTRVRIFKMLIQCCAADARPYSIPVEFGKEPPKFKDMSWVKVVGKITFKQENNQTVPLLQATSMSEAAAPDSKVTY